jgi:uncharacterized membrane protein
MTSGMTSASRKPGRLRNTSSGMRVTGAMSCGVAAGAIAAPFMLPVASILIGWDVAAAIYLAWTLGVVWTLDADMTEHLAKREDPSRTVAELAILGAGTSTLVAVGFSLLRAGQATGAMKFFLIALGVISVAVSWIVVHSVYMLRYARNYYTPPVGGVDFNEDEPPTYLDFAYLSFTLGMTFQVSDTNITSKRIRRIALRHALLSFVFGAVILAVAINVVASLF